MVAGAPSNQRFTSYDRSGATGLDYAVNRTYNPGQSRFTQVDPIGMASVSIGNPQSLNLFAYVQNNPVDSVDPSGLITNCGIQYGLPPCQRSDTGGAGGRGGSDSGGTTANDNGRSKSSGSRGGGGGDNPISTSTDAISDKIEPRLLSDEDCNFLFGALFGDMLARATSNIEPAEVKYDDGSSPKWAGANRYLWHLGKLGVMHIYPSETSQRVGAPLYVPSNSDGSAPKPIRSYEGQSAYTEYGTGKFTTGEYREGNNKGVTSNRFLFSYKSGLVLLVAHVAGGTGGTVRGARLGSTFVSTSGNLIGPRNALGSLQIGFIGGPGGNGPFVIRHTHISMWYEGKLIDPKKAFCGGGLN